MPLCGCFGSSGSKSSDDGQTHFNLPEAAPATPASVPKGLVVAQPSIAAKDIHVEVPPEHPFSPPPPPPSPSEFEQV